MQNFKGEQLNNAELSIDFSENNLFLCKKHARQRVLRANKNLIPKGSKFKIKNIKSMEVLKRT
jgi:hypothetical protein